MAAAERRVIGREPDHLVARQDAKDDERRSRRVAAKAHPQVPTVSRNSGGSIA